MDLYIRRAWWARLLLAGGRPSPDPANVTRTLSRKEVDVEKLDRIFHIPEGSRVVQPPKIRPVAPAPAAGPWKLKYTGRRAVGRRKEDLAAHSRWIEFRVP